MTVTNNMVLPKIEGKDISRNYGKFIISPLESGYGITLGNALRRVLLASLEGAAVSSLRVSDVPSMIVRPGDNISVRDGSRTRTYFKDLAAAAETRTVPRWLERDLKALAGKVVQNPERTDIDANLHEQLIVEFYSR